MTIKEKIDTWLEDAKSDLIKNYDEMGLRAFGQWARELEPQTIIEQDKYHAKMLGMDYTYYLEHGRGPSRKKGKGGGRSLREIIREWIDVKGIVPDGISKDSLAFLIARKIHIQGIRVPNQFNRGGLVGNVITRSRVDELIKNTTMIFIADFKSTIIKELK
jgi:hypothetical protein